MTTNKNPLAALRKKGLNVDIENGRVKVWPKDQMKPADCMFVTGYLPEIVEALFREQFLKRHSNSIKDYFLWEMPNLVGTRYSNIRFMDMGKIPNRFDGRAHALKRRGRPASTN